MNIWLDLFRRQRLDTVDIARRLGCTEAQAERLLHMEQIKALILGGVDGRNGSNVDPVPQGGDRR